MYYKLLPLVNRARDNEDAGMQFINSFCSNSLLKYNSYEDIREFARRLGQLDVGYVFLYATGFSAIPVEYLTKKTSCPWDKMHLLQWDGFHRCF